MIDLTAWPLESDVQEFLEKSGAWDSSANLDLAKAIEDAVDDFEEAIERRPFLNAEETVTTRVFSAPGPIRRPHATLVGGGRNLSLGTGVLSITSLLVDDVPFTEGTHYFEARFDTDAPITMIRFASNVFFRPNGIAIEGAWGYCSILPRTAFNAVLARAVIKVLPTLANRRRVTAEASTGPIKAKETGPVRTEYAVSTADKTTDFAALTVQLNDDWRRGVNRFRLAD